MIESSRLLEGHSYYSPGQDTALKIENTNKTTNKHPKFDSFTLIGF